MKKQIIVATFLYTLFNIILFILIFKFFDIQNSFFIATLSLIILSFIFGYILNSYILSQKFSMDENLLNLTKEIIHELNIPLSTIEANIMLIKRSNRDNKLIKRLNRIENASKRLKRLYGELVYSIKKEIQTVEKEDFELIDLIEERVNELKILNRNPFELNLSSHIIRVDRIGFEKMLDNILINAMKYSPKESPIIINLKDYILTIKDNGIGIDETELIRIYERYYQSDRNSYGEGIGLALVKSYCDSEKIKIKISSQKGVGTTVSFDLYKVVQKLN
jgi:signal transduction histidine kinase